MRGGCLVLSLLICGVAGLAGAESADRLRARQQEAQSQRTQLQAAIRALHQQIESTEASRREVANELRASEKAISDAGRRLVELGEQQAALETDIAALQARAEARKQALGVRQAELARQLQAQYANGLSPWAALLSGDDPQAIARELGYLSYVSQAQAQAIRAIRQALDDLAQAEQALQARRQELTRVLAEVSEQKQALETQRAEREKVLVRIAAQLQAQRQQADVLKRDEQRLGRLVRGLEETLARQAELARQAAEQRRQEQARQAQAVQPAGTSDEGGDRHHMAPSAPRSQAPVETARADGLSKGLAFPVQGEVLGRFGTGRPDGGVWRGIVLRAAEGTPVRAIAPGTVVYANWLKGFGNMLIVDHGKQYMSIYAYNQSLLKAVGDTVSAGQVIATVGATGGQVEPGLYFEIRHQGAPVNPLLWLRR